jgi:hypothetical protein
MKYARRLLTELKKGMPVSTIRELLLRLGSLLGSPFYARISIRGTHKPRVCLENL